MTKPRRPLGPVHLYPERPKTLKRHDHVALAEDPRRFGRVVEEHPRLPDLAPQVTIRWDDGEVLVHTRDELLSRFTSTTPAPSPRKAAA